MHEGIILCYKAQTLKWQSLAVTFLVQVTAGIGWIFLLKSYIWVYMYIPNIYIYMHHKKIFCLFFLVFKSMRRTD